MDEGAVRLRRVRACAATIFVVGAALAAVAAGSAQAASTVTLTASTSSPGPGDTVTLTATVPGATSGVIRFTLSTVPGSQTGDVFATVPVVDGSAQTVVSQPPGTYYFQAAYVPGAIPDGWSPVVAVTWAATTKHPTAIALTSTPIAAATPATFTATVTTTDGSGVVPTGVVSFWDNQGTGNVVIADNVPLVNGVATSPAMSFAAGTTHSFTATYGGDPLTESAPPSNAIAVTIAPNSPIRTTITPYASPNPVPPGEIAQVRAQVLQEGGTIVPPSGGYVSFYNADNNQLIGTSLLHADGYTDWLPLSSLPAGRSYRITAKFTGDINFNFASSSSDPLEIAYAAAVVTVTAPSASIVYGQPIPALTPTYSSGTAPATPATCTTTATPSSPAGSYPVTCSGAADPGLAFTYAAGTLTIAKAPLTVKADDKTTISGDPLPALTATLTGFVNGDTAASSVTGAAACTTTATSTSPGGTYPITCTAGTLASDRYAFTGFTAGTLTVIEQLATTLKLTSPPIAAVGKPLTLSATLTARSQPVAGQTVTISLGTASCTGTTDAAGVATCTLTPTGPVGPAFVTASFAGASRYLRSTDTNPILLYALPGGGSFVVGDRSATPGAHVTFWGAQWSKLNSLSGGTAPAGFKGYAGAVSGSRWVADPGNSTPPPAGPLPQYIGVIVASSATKSGAVVSGSVVRIVVVKVDNGYDGNPGHAGTGTIVSS